MTENKKAEKNPSKSEIAVAKKNVPDKVARKQPAVSRAKSQDLSQAFDEAFERFRNDFEDLLFPFSDIILVPESRVPAIDLEDREKDYVLKAEMPGFKKEEIEINVQDDGVEITGTSGWKYNDKEQDYICKERECETFYRFVYLPEEIKVDDVKADLCEGILEITLPKKTPKQKRKIQLK